MHIHTVHVKPFTHTCTTAHAYNVEYIQDKNDMIMFLYKLHLNPCFSSMCTHTKTRDGYQSSIIL